MAVCANCGNSFEQRPRQVRRCCGSACAKARMVAGGNHGGNVIRERYPVLVRECERCHQRITRRRNTNDALRFCSKKCSGAQRTANKRARIEKERETRQRRECRFCGTPFIAPRGQRVCSEACRLAEARGAHVRRHDLTCPCGAPLVYQKWRTRNRFCSVACRNRGDAAKRAKRKAKAARRARKRALPYEQIDPYVVFARDGWRCQLCRGRTPGRLRGSLHQRAPELDHIVPLSRGGAHTYANTQCLCRQCNQAKSDKVLGQLRLAI